MLTAIHPDLGQVSAADYRNRWQELIEAKNSFLCPQTQAPVVPRREHTRQNGQINVAPHFRYYSADLAVFPEGVCFDPEFMRQDDMGRIIPKGESWEHRQGKLYAVDNLKQLLEIEKGILEAEKRIDLADGRWRIADVALTVPSGLIIIVEIQLASITPELLEQRTLDYESIGCVPYWWLGKSANTRTNQQWYYDRFGVQPCLLSFGGHAT